MRRASRAPRRPSCGHPRSCDDHLARGEPRERRVGIARETADQAQFARREIRRRDPHLATQRVERAEIVVAPDIQQVVAERRARRDRLDHGALHDPLREPRILDLLADRHAVSLLHEATQVLRGRLHRHAGQRHLRRAAVVPRGQREVQRARRHLGVLVEHLVEVAHPEEQDRVGMPRLDLPVLRHQRRRAAAAHPRGASTRNPSLFSRVL
jgi:hypothetical protein